MFHVFIIITPLKYRSLTCSLALLCADFTIIDENFQDKLQYLF